MKIRAEYPPSAGTDAWGLEPLMDVAELASYLGLPVSTVYDWRLRGKGPVTILRRRSSVRNRSTSGAHLKIAFSVRMMNRGQSLVPSLWFQSGGHASRAASRHPPTLPEGQVSGGSSP
ncbi:helix-turn-helix domain-containing protein [Leifsonia sp. A12D58]|uniref:helix-turn-helix domain-containing protein n=1 Tax=Leifsonia sp. A12D58 TaxID=3397674 RepID=UPI0039E13507